MSPKYRHEKYNLRLDHLVWELVGRARHPLPIAQAPHFRREGARAGKEANTGFYIANQPAVRDKDEIDLAVNPPPDLAIEVNNFNNSEGKLPIYAALRTPRGLAL